MSYRSQVFEYRKRWYEKNWSYSFRYYKYFDFSRLSKIMTIQQGTKSKTDIYNDCIIMFDTETSKETAGCVCKNYVVAWTISIRAFGLNIVTLYGTRPSEFVYTVNQMIMNMSGEKTLFYAHNLAYDWVFLRKWMMAEWGTPAHQLNTKPHYPIWIEFSNGIILRDSLCLAQRSLDKWAKDLGVAHQKACGFWDYDKVRMQDSRFSPEEKTYIEHDTLAGVECLDATMKALGKHVYSMPYTATGIPREIVRKIAKANRGRERFQRLVSDYDTQCVQEDVFHGGYTHNNRHFIERVIYADEAVDGWILGMDFASSYPAAMLLYKYPMERFVPRDPCTPQYILRNKENYAYMFKLILIRPHLKDDFIPMPALQISKGKKMINEVEDNGRVLCADYFEIYLNEIDLEVIMQQYDYDKAVCVDVRYAEKDYLPRWFTDYVYQCFRDKTMLKGGDPVLYSIAKAKLNSLYGMCVQKPIRENIVEDYQTGEFDIEEGQNRRELYDKYIKNFNSVLPYQWGVWVTAYSFRQLFKLGSCAGTWLYSDTDSVYGYDWDQSAIDKYNKDIIAQMKKRGYGAVHHNGRDYWPGVAELDGEYSEFISVGAKRYATRDTKGKLKITVAGVPKKGFQCLKDDLHNFHAGLIFDGATTGKLQHTYFFEPDIWTDENGNERGDSIDLSPADYLLASVTEVDWQSLFYEDVNVDDYEVL